MEQVSADILFGLGRGISVRREHLAELVQELNRGAKAICSRLDWVEIVPENFMGRGGWVRRALMDLAELRPVCLHGVSLSIGGTDPLSSTYLTELGKLARDVRARWVTDHLSYSSVEATEFHNLLPLPFTKEVVSHVVDRIQEVQEFLGVPFGLENPTYYVAMPGAEMSEAEFISEIVRRSGCGLLLDVNNVFVNQVNLYPWESGGFAGAIERSKDFLRQLPLQHVFEVHVAGHTRTVSGKTPVLLDTHGSKVSTAVKEVLLELHRLQPVQSLLLERESELPPLLEIVTEVDSLWKHLGRNRPYLPSPSTRALEFGFQS